MLFLFFVILFFFVYQFFSFISYTSEPAKGTFILAAGGRSGTLFWGGPRGGISGGGGGGPGRGGAGGGRGGGRGRGCIRNFFFCVILAIRPFVPGGKNRKTPKTPPPPPRG